MRLDRFLQNSGVCSRKEAKKIISTGKIMVNGEICLNFELKIDENKDEICMSGNRIVYEKYIYIVMNKPEGFVCATEDRRDRTVLELLPDNLRRLELFPVGRLDKDTTGLLILTNDGAFAHEMLSPKKKVMKTYLAVVDGPLDERDTDAFASGISIGDYTCLPAELEILEPSAPGKSLVSICEGKFHQVKRMFKALDKNVLSLERISFGSLKLDGKLSRGEYRPLEKFELEMLRLK